MARPIGSVAVYDAVGRNTSEFNVLCSLGPDIPVHMMIKYCVTVRPNHI